MSEVHKIPHQSRMGFCIIDATVSRVAYPPSIFLDCRTETIYVREKPTVGQLETKINARGTRGVVGIRNLPLRLGVYALHPGSLPPDIDIAGCR